MGKVAQQPGAAAVSSAAATAGVPLLPGKVRRPRCPKGLVARERLLARCDGALEVPLTLVSAPAGFGKSVLVSQWVEARQLDCAWLSLDPADADPRLFLSYLLAAMDTVAPELCSSVSGVRGAVELPPSDWIAGHLANDLERLSRPFVLVLDDYHVIPPSSSVHDLVRSVLQASPRSLHLVIISRRDPPLPLASLRAGGGIIDIDQQDLRFTRAETADFFAQNGGLDLGTDALDTLENVLEGWAVGLRLLSLELRDVDDADVYVGALRGGRPQMREYLMQEVLAHQPRVIQECLLRSSVVSRFGPGLLEAICRPDAAASDTGFSGRDTIDLLQQGNLFTGELDEHGDWYRYHQVFREFLGRQLERELKPDEIAALHARACAWFDNENLVEEAVHHALAAGDPERAADIVASRRIEVLDRGGLWILDHWLDLLPEELFRRRADLLSARALALVEEYRLGEISTVLDEAESLLAAGESDDDVATELDMLRGLLLVLVEGDGAAARARLQRGIARGHSGSGLVQGRLSLYLAVARQLLGEGESPAAELAERVGLLDSSDRPRLARTLAGLALVRLFAGSLEGGAHEAQRGLDLMAVSRHPEIEGFLWYLMGNARFQQGEFASAADCFREAARRKESFSRRFAVDALLGLMLAHELHGDPEHADEIADELAAWAVECGDLHLLGLARSGIARRSMLRGELEEAMRWADGFDGAFVLSDTFFFLECSAITQLRIRIGCMNEDGVRSALETLRPLRDRLVGLHLVAQVIDVLVLEAVALARLGQPGAAWELLQGAVQRAERHGFVRPFVEAGGTVRDLLASHAPVLRKGSFTRRLLEVCAGDGSSPSFPETPVASRNGPAARKSDPAGVDPLTSRELDVLELLGKRLQNKEIADELHISPHTVHAHLRNIFRKLDVSDRRQAAKRAAELGVLPEQ